MSRPTLAGNLATLSAFAGLVAESSGGERLALDGVLAYRTHHVPESSWHNGVVFQQAAGLERALPELEKWFSEAGVTAWRVWAPAADKDAVRVLGRYGLRTSVSTMAMGLDLAAPAAETPQMPVERGTPIGEVAAVNDLAEDAILEPYRRAFELLDDDACERYAIRGDDGSARAVGVGFDRSGDCGVFIVATLPDARRQGLATALVAQIVADARVRGAATASLQATREGIGAYRSCGFIPLGRLDHWERHR